jgi:hypothetical protein
MRVKAGVTGAAISFRNLANIPNLRTSQYNEAPQITVTQNGVYKLLHGLNQHKATGPDEISTKFLKEMAAPVTPALTLIFQASLNQGQTPEDWKLANVSPIFKKGDKSKPANYRPVSLTSVCCKVIEHIIHSHLNPVQGRSTDSVMMEFSCKSFVRHLVKGFREV